MIKMNLQKQHKDLIKRINFLKEEISLMQKQLAPLVTQEKELKTKIDALNTPLTVSDHALVKYLERVSGLSLDSIREEILSDELKAQVAVLGNDGKFSNGKYKLVIKNGTVVTIY